jgi:hypothetical protein
METAKENHPIGFMIMIHTMILEIRMAKLNWLGPCLAAKSTLTLGAAEQEDHALKRVTTNLFKFQAAIIAGKCFL